ncbi:unnamed protein product [Paramecium octaurelia]|uniref:Phosphodiesterase n=1 Tax=Paramecium octaurelia TaxID=43137 RepID=A0A8S1TVS8_PAROT|nr:unnamed protein product [Paramecium octaurelia]
MNNTLLPNLDDKPYYHIYEPSLKETLNAIHVESQTESLSPNDEKSIYIQNVIMRMFPEIQLRQHSILICQHLYTKTYTIFFMNSKQVPYSYCCNRPLQVRCYPIGFGLVLCSGERCSKPELKAFKFSDNTPKLEEKLNNKLSKLISMGKHKHVNLIQQKQRFGLEEFKKHVTETPDTVVVKPRKFKLLETTLQIIKMDPQLSHYTQFFIVVTNLCKTNQISSEQKALLKSSLTHKEEKICRVLIQNSGPGKEMQLRQALLDYLEEQNKAMQRRRQHKSKTMHFTKEVSDEDKQQNTSKQEQSIPQPLAGVGAVMIDQLTELLNKHIEKHNLLVPEDKEKLLSLCNLILQLTSEQGDPNGQHAQNTADDNKLAEISEKDADSSEEDVYDKMKRQIDEIYKELKNIFTGNLHTHLLLMQEDISYENLYQVLKFLLKILVDADEFTFFIHRDKDWEVYSSANDSIKDVTPEEALKVNDELTQIRPSYIHRVDSKLNQYPQIQETCKTNAYAQTSIVKFQLHIKNYEVLFCLHWTDKDKNNIKRNFINNANIYGFNTDVTHLAQFLVETIITAKVQFFNPLRFADHVQDIGITFMRISRFLLLEGIKQVLSAKYEVEQEQQNQTEGLIKKSNDLPSLKIELKDSNLVTLSIKNLDLKNEQDSQLYSLIIQILEKYDGYVKLCYEKSAFYKYFLRTTDSLLFDFNKQGELIFLSRPISKAQKQRYNINFDPKAILYNKITYQDIFAENSIISNIEVNIQNIHENRQNQYLSNVEIPQFEIFLKVIDNDFKGFTVIFHENEARRLKHYFMTLKIDSMTNDVQKEAEVNKSFEEDIQRQILIQYNKHQTFKFLNQLDETQDVANSMIALFIPENELQQIRHRKPDVKGSDSQSKDMQIDQWIIPPQKKKKISSSVYIKYQQQLEQVDINQFKILERDSQLDQFEFNILTLDSSQEKHRLVYSILEKNGFISQYNMNNQSLAQFLSVLQQRYNKKNNSFHNYDHGISVMQSAHFMLQCEKAKQFIDDFRRMATIISGLCHDVSHTGRTNVFMINSQSKLATRYHDSSPLEQHHAATTIFMLKDSSLNFLSNLTKEQHQQFRRILIDNILYTDIKVHFTLLKDFESRIKDDVTKPFGTGDDDLKLLTGMIIHTADFNGGAKVFDISRIWSERVNKEFSAQYEEEGRLGIPQTPFLKDLHKIHIMAKSEMGFFKVIVRPLWFTLNAFFDGYLHQSITNLDNTIISWEKIYHANLPKEERPPQQS